MKWHTLSKEDVEKQWQSADDGLTAAEVAERLDRYGPNQLEEGRKKSAWGILLAQFLDVMILILAAAAILSALVGDLADMIVILVIIVLNAFVGFIQEYRAEQAMQLLKQLSVVQVKAMRDGRMVWLPATELVPGDQVFLEAGNAVPADIRLTESHSLKVEEAALTGESVAVDKSTVALEGDDLPLGDRVNMAYKGTYVVHGRGRGIVVATGMHTELGRIARLLQGKEPPTPLQVRMAQFGKIISFVVIGLCILFFGVGYFSGGEPIRLLLTSISLAVAAIPEALPAVITISLALAARRMVQQHTLVRKLAAVETLGSVTYICTDKTGTLTRNRMHVEELFAGQRFYARAALPQANGQEDIRLLLQAFAANNDSEVNPEGIRGDSTEVALLEVALEHNIRPETLQRLAEIPFDADRKLMTTFHPCEGRVIAFTKGAPDLLVQRCRGIDPDVLHKKVEVLAAKGQRVLGFACRFWEEVPGQPHPEQCEQDLQFLGLAGLIDPPREEVPDAVQQCKTAGMVPVMITGDHPLTARSIAERVGILDAPAQLVLTGQELAALGEEAFASKVEQVRVYARVSPEQKLRIVTALQARKHFVAMTGDGVNDAPSLRRANIGIAMGITGTDVSKEAAHMILLDDNFSTIIRAVREGRRIYDNILKFLKYIMTTNAGELWTLLLGPLLGLPVALLPIHILWMNLVSDGLPAIALSFEKEEENIMHRPPRPAGETLLAGGRGVHMLWVGLLMALLAIGTQYVSIREQAHWQTMVFNVLFFAQMAHVLAIRSERQSLFRQGLFSNKPLLASVLISIALQLAVTYLPLLQGIFHTEPLTSGEMATVIAASSLVFVAVEIEKALRRSRG